MGPVGVAVALGYGWYVGLLLNVRRSKLACIWSTFTHSIIHDIVHKSLNHNLCMCLFLSVREM